MKFCILALALLGAVAADVSHVNNMYLPPYMMKMFHREVDYPQQAQEIPKVSHVEISDSSDSAQEEPQLTTGQKSIQEVNNGLSDSDNGETHTEEKHFQTSHVYSSGHDDGAAPVTHTHTSTSVTTSEKHDGHKSEPDLSSRTSGSDSDTSSFTSTTSDTKTEKVADDKGKKSYLELLGPTVKPAAAVDQSDDSDNGHSSGSVHTESHFTTTSSKSAPTPGSDLITHSHGTSSSSSTSVSDEDDTAAPAVVSRTSGVDTKYGDNGGYVY